MVRRRHRPKSGKYGHELGSASGALATLRLVGSGNPPLHRFRVGLEFAVSGRRDLDGMIVQHAALARGLAEQLGLSPVSRMAVGAAYEQWDGKGWPGNLKGEDIPVASRLAQIGEFIEVAHRIGRHRSGGGAGRQAGRVAVRPRPGRYVLCATPRRSLTGSTPAAPGTR